MIVFCDGMPRSGSTWSFNVCRDLLESVSNHVYGGYHERTEEWLPVMGAGFEHAVIKTHLLDDAARALRRLGAAVSVYTHRDPCDAVVSCMMMFGQSFDAALQTLAAALDVWRFEAALRGCQEVPYAAIAVQPYKSVEAIARLLQTPCSPELIADVEQRTRPDEMRRLAAAVDGVLYDPRTLLHRNHLRDGGTGYGRERLSQDQIAAIGELTRSASPRRDNCSAILLRAADGPVNTLR
jgi:hypothetical protein